MSTITSSKLWPLFQKTVKNLRTDRLKKEQCCYGVAVPVKSMDAGIEEDMEIGGIGLLEVKGEGKAMATDTIVPGGKSKFMPVTLAKKVMITHEALRDNKYEQALQISKRLFAAAWKTQDLDAADLFINATTSTVTGGYDGVCLASTAHVLPSGQHANNILGSDVDGTAVGMTPSVAAFQAARSMAVRSIGPSGLSEPLELKAVWFPDGMTDLINVITGTSKDVGTNHNDLNTVATDGAYKVKKYAIRHLDAVNPNLWGFLTNAEDGIQIRRREQIQSHAWTANDEMVAFHGVHYAQAQGWSDWRHIILGYS